MAKLTVDQMIGLVDARTAEVWFWLKPIRSRKREQRLDSKSTRSRERQRGISRCKQLDSLTTIQTPVAQSHRGFSRGQYSLHPGLLASVVPFITHQRNILGQPKLPRQSLTDRGLFTLFTARLINLSFGRRPAYVPLPLFLSEPNY